MYFECPVCGNKRAVLRYDWYNHQDHAYLSSYGPYSAIRCPKQRECVWLERKSGIVLAGEPWAKKVLIEA